MFIESMFKGIGKKITLAFSAVTLTIVIVGLFVWSNLSAVQSSNENASRNVHAATAALTHVQHSIYEELWAAQEYHRRPTEQAIHAFQEARKTMHEAIQSLTEFELLSLSESDSLSNVEHQFHRSVQQMFELIDSLHMVQRAGHVEKERKLLRSHQDMMSSLDLLHQRLMKILLTVQGRANGLLEQTELQNNNAITDVKILLGILIVFGIAITIVIWLMTERYVARPLHELTQDIRTVELTDLNRNVAITGTDEIRLLQESFNQLLKDLHQNIQAKREAELLLMQEHKLAAIGQLAQGIAHNLNNPLGVILLSAQSLKKSSNPTNQAALIEQAAYRMKSIIETLLYKSRQEQTTERQLIDFNQLLREELGFLEADLDFKHKIQKDYQLAPNLPRIEGVYSDFSQSIMNIVRNAIDAMYQSQTKRLSVHTRFDDDAIYIDIADTGYGIPEEIRARMFDPFFTTKPMQGQEKEGEPSGTGLGLSSCLQLLRPYGAAIEVQSEVGRGSIFTIKIPVQQRRKEQAS